MRGRSFVPPTRPGPSLTLLMTRHPEQRRLRRVSDTPLEPRTRDPSPSARLRMTCHLHVTGGACAVRQLGMTGLSAFHTRSQDDGNYAELPHRKAPSRVPLRAKSQEPRAESS